MKRIIITTLLITCIVCGSCTVNNDFDRKLNTIVKPHLFNYVNWEIKSLGHEFVQLFGDSLRNPQEEIDTVIEYFAIIQRIKDLQYEQRKIADEVATGNPDTLQQEINSLSDQKNMLQDTVERILEKQVRQALTEMGIYNPAYEGTGLRFHFPPMNFKLEKPPYLLVLSPRDRIESMQELTLVQNLTLEEKEDIEKQVDRLGVSSLVVTLGGLGATCPTFVTNTASLGFTIDTIAEEWLHQYLAFKPLGFLYVLDATGISLNYEIATMNETVAGIISEEIGDIVINTYYPEYADDEQSETTGEDFDFDAEMRQIRITVDNFLLEGKIEQAEEYMEERRQFLLTQGYYIRKLNQAYFAFHGAYADEPTSVSPIGEEMRALRAKSASLKEFLETVSSLTDRKSLRESIR